jgi:uncharacterized protein (DUF1697 family)
MADLTKVLSKLGFENIITILNSGNVIYNAKENDLKHLEAIISENLERTFGFLVPVIIKEAGSIQKLIENNPFKDIEITKDIRLYVSFLKEPSQVELEIPWANADNSYKILEKRNNTIFSVLDLEVSKTPEAMGILEKFYGSDMTTRNWKTIERIVKKML